MKTLAKITLLCISMTLTAHATTIVPPDSKLIPLKKRSSSTSTQNDFNFTDFDTSENQITDILFFYTPAALAQSGGVEGIHDYINVSLDYNNLAFKNSHIPITRRVAAVLPAPFDFNEQEPDTTTRVKSFREQSPATTHAQYKASYFVLLHGRYSGQSGIGGAFVGQEHSVVSTYYQSNGDPYERTIGHELGHSDGLGHSTTSTSKLTAYGKGYSCDKYKSIMFSDPNKTSAVPFFSSPSITAKEIPCGLAGEADATEAYQIHMSQDFANREGTFTNIKTPRERVGEVSFDLEAVTLNETDGTLTVTVNWIGAPEAASVEIYTEYGTADEGDIAYSAQRIQNDGTSTISIDILDDAIFEPAESFSIKMRHASGVNIGNANEQVVSIESDDIAVRGFVEFDLTSISINEGDSSTITVNRINGSNGAFDVTVSSLDGTATSDDYSATNQTIHFNEGQTSANFSISTKSDILSESLESYTLTLSSTEDVIGNNKVVTVNISNIENNSNSSSEPEQENSSGGGTGWFFLIATMVTTCVRKQVNLCLR